MIIHHYTSYHNSKKIWYTSCGQEIKGKVVSKGMTNLWGTKTVKPDEASSSPRLVTCKQCLGIIIPKQEALVNEMKARFLAPEVGI